MMTVGLLETGSFSFNPEIAARSILENFVRWRARAGAPIPCLDTITSVRLPRSPSPTPAPALFQRVAQQCTP